MEKELVERFLNKFVKLVKYSPDPNNTRRNTFNLYGTVKEVTDESVVLFTDRLGIILLKDVVSIEEAPDRRPQR